MRKETVSRGCRSWSLLGYIKDAYLQLDILPVAHLDDVRPDVDPDGRDEGVGGAQVQQLLQQAGLAHAAVPHHHQLARGLRRRRLRGGALPALARAVVRGGEALLEAHRVGRRRWKL